MSVIEIVVENSSVVEVEVGDNTVVDVAGGTATVVEIVSAGPQGPQGPAGPSGEAAASWIDVAGAVEYTGVKTVIASGKVLTCDFDGGTAYRFINAIKKSNGYPLEDSFYADFDGVALTNLIVTRYPVRGCSLVRGTIVRYGTMN